MSDAKKMFEGEVPRSARKVNPPIATGVAHGLDWEVKLSPLKSSANGYIILDKSHPWFGKDYADLDVEVHGGLTYGREGKFGFDTAHAWDDWSDDALAEIGGDSTHAYHEQDARYFWTLAKLIGETQFLASQAAEAKSRAAHPAGKGL